jgi:hypothetical protein
MGLAAGLLFAIGVPQFTLKGRRPCRCSSRFILKGGRRPWRPCRPRLLSGLEGLSNHEAGVYSQRLRAAANASSGWVLAV